MLNAQRSEPVASDTVLSLAVLAHESSVDVERMSEFRVLVRHFLDRFFGNEFASADGDAKTRLVQVACAIGVPPFVLSLYLYPAYHLPFHRVRPYWGQAGDHDFFVLYTMVAMGLVAVFEWDLLFPDLLDVLVLASLPVRAIRLLLTRMTAIVILIAAAIFDASFLAPVVLPAATDPPHFFRFLAAHCVAVVCSGIFGATSILALEGLLLSLFGDRWFRRVSLWLQGILVVALLMLLFLHSVIANALEPLLRLHLSYFVPCFWFLGIYQRILDGPSTLPVFAHLAHVGFDATVAAVMLAAISYPLAWRRRTLSLVEGGVAREPQPRLAAPFQHLLHATAVRMPACRAVWHFIGQNLLRVPRYRMVLVFYGGAGVALVLAAVLRVNVAHGHLRFVLSPAGVRAMVPIVAFWTASGLRSTFLAPADQRGRWIFRVITGKPGFPHLNAARRWTLLWTLLLTSMAAGFASLAHAPLGLWRFAAAQGITAAALCFLLTDAFFLRVTTIPFTGSKSSSATNLALLLIPYLGFFPAIVLFTINIETWMEAATSHLLLAVAISFMADLCLRGMRRSHVEGTLRQIEADDDEEDFPLRLGLRY